MDAFVTDGLYFPVTLIDSIGGAPAPCPEPVDVDTLTPDAPGLVAFLIPDAPQAASLEPDAPSAGTPADPPDAPSVASLTPDAPKVEGEDC